MILPYASSLKSVSIGYSLDGTELPCPSDCALFEKFTQLAALNIWSLRSSPNSDVREVLKHLSSLTYLVGVKMERCSMKLFEHAPFLSDLRHLELYGDCEDSASQIFHTHQN